MRLFAALHCLAALMLSGLTRAADFIIAAVAYPPTAGRHPLNTFALDTGEPCSDYAEPPRHHTRHEAGRRHLAAARHT